MEKLWDLSLGLSWSLSHSYKKEILDIRMIFLGARRLYNLFSLLMILIYVTATKPCADILCNTMNRELQKVRDWSKSIGGGGGGWAGAERGWGMRF